MTKGPDEGARWATAGELRAAGWLDRSGWPLGRSEYGAAYLPSAMQEAGALVVAPPGAGKSRGVLVPALLSEGQRVPEARRSSIVVDPAGELYRLTARTLAYTHRIICWNPANPRMSNTYFDPLAYLGSPRDGAYEAACESAAACWYTATGGDQAGRSRGESYWETQPIAALTGLIAARAAVVPGLTITALAEHILPLTAEALAGELAASAHGAARRRSAVLVDLMKNEKALSGVVGELRRRLLVAANPVVAQTIGRPSLDVAALVDQPTVLYLQVGTGDQTARPLLSVALSTLLAQLMKLPTAGRPLSRPVRVVIDELQNIGELYDLAPAINTLRKYGVGFLLATQTRAGLYAVYGESKGNTIIEACNTFMGLGGVAPDDAEWFSRQLGQRDWQEVTKERSWGVRTVGIPTIYTDVESLSGRLGALPLPYLHRRTQTRYERRRMPLASADALRAMDRAMVVVPTRLRPFLVSLALYQGD